MNDVSTQVMPDKNVYLMGWQTLEKPTAGSYVKALDYADKNTVSPNDNVFKATTEPKSTVNAFAQTSAPIENETVLIQQAPSMDPKTILLLVVVGFVAYKMIKKGK